MAVDDTTESEREPQAPWCSRAEGSEIKGEVSESVPGTRRTSGTCGRSAIVLSCCLHADF